jgi:hypothetical protein
MEIRLCVLKCGNQSIRSNTSGPGSIHLTNRLLDADYFISEELAQAFVQSLIINSADYMIDPAIKINDLKIVIETMKIEDDSKNL